jgi:ubiquinone/menaquinone biosynthesis C-methylase UbiE
MFMNPFTRRDNPYPLVVGMTGVKMGDRFAQIGCADGGRLAAVAAKVGLSGRAAAAVPDEASADRARKAAARAGVLVEVDVASPSRLPFEDGAFNIAIIDNTAGLMTTMRAEDRVAMVREAARILVPGGRVMVLSRAERGGIGAVLSRAQSGPPFDPQPALQADGFKAVRLLAAREGLVFVEGLKQRV